MVLTAAAVASVVAIARKGVLPDAAVRLRSGGGGGGRRAGSSQQAPYFVAHPEKVRRLAPLHLFVAARFEYFCRQPDCASKRFLLLFAFSLQFRSEGDSVLRKHNAPHCF